MAAAQGSTSPDPEGELPTENLAAASGEADEEHGRQARAPWHFKVVAVGSVVYLGYRLYQGVSWLVHHI